MKLEVVMNELECKTIDLLNEELNKEAGIIFSPQMWEVVGSILLAQNVRYEYPHLLICSGDRRFPAGEYGHGCCCLSVGVYELALKLAVNERNTREQKIDEILETTYANLRTPEDFIDQAKRHLGADKRFKEVVSVAHSSS